MGIVSRLVVKAKQKVSNTVTKAAGMAVDAVEKTSVLSPAQLEKVDAKREAYLNQMPSPDDAAAEEQTSRLIAAAGVEIYHAYLAQLKELYLPVEKSAAYEGQPFDTDRNIRFFNITKWVVDAEENSLEKLVNVYEVLSNEDCNISLVFHRTKDKTVVYLAVTNTLNDNNNTDADSYYERLSAAILGNFPGSEWAQEKQEPGRGVLPCLNNNRPYSVAVASNIPAEKSEKFVSQTIEKLLDGIVPTNRKEEYIIILLATPVLDIDSRKLQLTELYTGLAPFATWSKSYAYNESDATTSSGTVNLNLGLSVGNQRAHGTTSSSTTGGSAAVSTGVKILKWSGQLTGSIFHSVANGITDTLGRSFGGNFGVGFARASSVTATVGKSESIQQNFTNYNIQHALENLQTQMKRLEQSTALGMWDFAAYVLSEDQDVANNVAHSYLALTQGEESYLSQTAINLWRGDTGQDGCSAKEICDYLRQLRHPIFGLNPILIKNDPTYNVYPVAVTAAASLSGKELAYSLNFPRRSVAGLPVLECARFGRNIVTCGAQPQQGDRFALGHIFHMNKEENTRVFLAKDSLTAHTLVTGSTGSGKSNTVYQILDEAIDADIPFLVIEPAKGEYKNVFGLDDDVRVLGTNPHYAELLRINPFRFPEGIHVLEHIDRLIEIFNVCWPMYAAMPAVLKDAVLGAYEDCGWELTPFSKEPEEKIYPTFADVMEKIQQVIETSAYSADTKGDYIGSLVTRVHSLANGINGQIFTPDELSDEEMFDHNVIIDLSRIQSQETKALIMGILVMRLNEYRMVASPGMNLPLQHLTVLEEAHHLLKRTSGIQNPDAPSIAGKSVEMLANSIAEMRTYGEGFIIVDQSPSALDSAAIRNTNTKIIMRLPDEADRRLAGKSAAMKDGQLDELAKLIKGVAVVYQNDWLEPVLCKIDLVKTGGEKYRYQPSTAPDAGQKAFRADMLWLLLKHYMPEKTEHDIDLARLRREVLTQNIPMSTKRRYLRWIEEYKQKGSLALWNEINPSKLSNEVTRLLDCNKQVAHLLEQSVDVTAIDRQIRLMVEERIGELQNRYMTEVVHRILWCCCGGSKLDFENEQAEEPETFKLFRIWQQTIGGETIL